MPQRNFIRNVLDCGLQLRAKDDDGERMLACDVCGIWQHTRCAGIPDMDVVPARFLCYRCSSSSSLLTGVGGECVFHPSEFYQAWTMETASDSLKTVLQVCSGWQSLARPQSKERLLRTLKINFLGYPTVS